MSTIPIYRGDTVTISEPIKQADGTPFPLAGCTVWFTVKDAANSDQSDAGALAELYWVSGGASNGISVTDPTTGVVKATLLPAVTATMSRWRRYVYDCQVKDAGGLITTVDSGTITVSEDSTLRVTTP